MNKFFSQLKNIRLLKMVVVFLAGVFLFFVQACSSVEATTPPAKAPQQTVGPQSAEPNSEVYVPKGTDVTSPYEGGINNFSDVDPRRGEADVKAKTKALKDNAQSHLNKSIDSPEQYKQNYQEGAPLGERVKRLGENVGTSAEELREGVSKGTQQGIENIKENTKNAAKDLSQSAEETKSNVGRKAEDVGEAVNKSFKDSATNAQKSTDKLVARGQEAINNAKASVESKTNEVARSAQSNLEKLSNEFDDD